MLAEPGPSDVYVYGQSVSPLGSYLSGLDLGGEFKVSGSQIVNSSNKSVCTSLREDSSLDHLLDLHWKTLSRLFIPGMKDHPLSKGLQDSEFTKL